jgi:hypothetical protein
MPGAVSIRFARDPDYFLGASIMGNPCEVLVVRNHGDGRVAAMGCRAERAAFVNGLDSRLGYIGQIRVAEGFRGAWLVQRGAQWFKDRGERDLLYFGVIASENPRARRLLTGARLPGGVSVRRMSGMTTCAIVLGPRRVPTSRGVDVRPCTHEGLGELVAFLQRHGPRRQFFPAYRAEDFTSGARMRGLKAEDIMVARRGDEVVGTLAAWDQSAYKQDVVEDYGPALRRLRPLYDLAAKALGFAPLTPPGAAIPLAFAACVCIADDDLNVMRLLLAACSQRVRAGGKAFLMLGLADNDPLLPVARQTLHVPYHSDLFAASWAADRLAKLDARVPYVEIATL